MDIIIKFVYILTLRCNPFLPIYNFKKENVMNVQVADRNMGEYPVFALEYVAAEAKLRLVEDPDPTDAQIVSSSIDEIALFVSNKLKMKYKLLGMNKLNPDALLPPDRPGFSFPLKSRHIKVMGKLADIELETWKKIIKIGKEYLEVTNRNWYQNNDYSVDQSYHIKKSNKEIIERIKKDENLRDSCKQFIEKCPSKWFRAIVKLALFNFHWNTDCTGIEFEGHNFPSRKCN